MQTSHITKSKQHRAETCCETQPNPTTGKAAVVIPAYNEEVGIQSVLDNLAQLYPLDFILPVLNGCTDHTRQTVLAHPLIASDLSRLAMIEYPLPLGIDTPRRLGADCAQKLHADAILFVDGDLTGDYADCLQRLLCNVLYKGCDLALTNCYPYIGYRSAVAKTVLYYREKLNRTLNLFSSIGLATPSHGPHCVSRHLIETLGTECFTTPPLLLAKAAEANLNICVAAKLDDGQWHSAQRGNLHNEKIADTIIGDCIAAMEYIEGKPITRMDNGTQYWGYRTP